MRIIKKIFEQNKITQEIQNNLDKQILDNKALDDKNKNLENENAELNQLLEENENKYNELKKEYESNINEKKNMNINLQNLNKELIDMKEKIMSVIIIIKI